MRKGLTIGIIVFIAAVAIAIAAYYLYQAGGNTSIADQVGKEDADDDGCKSNPQVMSGIISIQECRKQIQDAYDAQLRAEQQAAEEAAKQAKKAGIIKAFLTGGISNLFRKK